MGLRGVVMKYIQINFIYIFHFFISSLLPVVLLAAQPHLSINFDANLAPQVCVGIEEYIRASKIYNSVIALCAQLVNRCAAIKDVAVKKMSPEMFQIWVTSYTPKASLNESRIISREGKLFSSSLFKNSEKLPQVKTPGGISNSCKKFIVSLDDTVLKDFDVEWKTATEIILRDKQQPLFIIKTKSSCPPNVLQLAACKRLKELLSDRGDLSESLQTQWCADLRFFEQIILNKT